MPELTTALLPWFERQGRHDLPWQQAANPYRVWVSEIMLQQTQVKTVIPYFLRFVECFPDPRTLAEAPLDRVLHLWTGLGYYARARNMHRAAGVIMQDYGGSLPTEPDALTALPGIGRSTAGAILALGYGHRAAILDGNVKRVLTRYYGIHGWPGHREVEKKLWELAERETPQQEVAAYTQAIMDLGATVCTRAGPRCADCPLATGCYARRHNAQQQLPTARPRRARPVRRAVFAVLENEQGEILLEQRPPTGVWGGLWSLPEYPSQAELADWIARRALLLSATLTPLPPLRHSFSHFHLDITPVRAVLRDRTDTIRDNDACLWYSPAQAAQIGLPAPVQALLKSFYSTGENTP